MHKRKNTDKLNNAVKDLIKDELSSIVGSEEEISPEELEQISTSTDSEKDSEIINKLLQSFPSTEGFYGKLYRRSSNGKLEFKHIVDLLEEIEDPEIEIHNLIKEKGWDDGDYMLRIFKRGNSDCKKTISWRMSIQPKISSGGNIQMSESPSLENKLSELRGIMNVVKEVTAPSASRAPEDTSKIIAESFKSGIEAMKSLIPIEKKEKSIEETITTLKTIGIIKDDKPMDLVQMITLIKELGLFKQEPKQDIWQEIIKFKELGLIRLNSDENKEDPLSQIEKLGNLIEAIKPLAGLSGAEGKPSAVLELIKILGPQVPKIIENITNTINKVAEVSKIKLSQRLNAMPAGHRMPISRERVSENTDLKENLEPELSPIFDEPKEEVVAMNPILKEIYDAVESNNTAYYIKLQELIILYIGGHVLNTVISKEVSVDTFCSIMSTTFNQEFLKTDKTKKYFDNFVNDLIIKYKTQNSDNNKNSIISRCTTCQTEYDFDNEDDFNSDNKVCDCGGIIERITDAVAGTA